jgi:pyruvate/2-oxoglutarate dehydrogenase complex dihydrolipoamide dehydrogenase (E3) component
VLLHTKPVRVYAEKGKKHIVVDTPDGRKTVSGEEILIGAGRQPNVDGLNLEAGGVEYDPRKGVKVDDFLRTTNPRIFAAGDICMDWKFTHAADAAAQIVLQNALFFGRKRLSDLTMPWCTYTDPEIAHVGLYAHDAEQQCIEIDTYKVEMKDVDRALADGEEEGFVKVVTRKGSDKILGATIVAAHAGDMISEISTAMAGGLGLGGLAGVIHPYPTQAEAIKRVAGAYRKTRLTPFVTSLFKKLLAWQRR